jgi:hypothetical protein
LTSKRIGAAVALTLAVGWLVGPASAAPIMCQDPKNNHMNVDSTYVSACLDAGVGNVNGNPKTDDFLLGNPLLDYVGIGDGKFSQTSKTKTGTAGTFSLNAALWDSWSEIAIGFKFGTGNNPDEWFVFTLNEFVSSGTWDFVNFWEKGGGLSHVQLYGSGPTSVPEPGTLLLMSAGMIGLAFARRRKLR